MSSIAELQIINKILQTGDYSIVSQNGLTPNYFIQFKEEFEFISNHYKDYGKVPDVLTFTYKFKDTPVAEVVNESDTYLVDKLFENYDFVKFSGVLQDIANELKVDSRAAYEKLMLKLPDIRPTMINQCVDITKEGADARLAKYHERKTLPQESAVIKTGFKELDEIFYGWEYGEELVTIVARSNQGKSWLALKFLAEAWKQGKRVGLYSGEMSDMQQGYRFDALFGHFSNTALKRGLEAKGYADYIEALKRAPNPFYIITPKDLKGRATVSKLRMFIEKNKLDILGVDQLSLTEDERASRGDQERIKLGHISADLYLLSCELGIPIIALVQANREAAKKGNASDDATPQLEDIRESDDISHNSSRVISMKQTKAGLLINVIKNRGGRNGDRLLYHWDIDTGYFHYAADFGDTHIQPETKQELVDYHKNSEVSANVMPF